MVKLHTLPSCFLSSTVSQAIDILAGAYFLILNISEQNWCRAVIVVIVTNVVEHVAYCYITK